MNTTGIRLKKLREIKDVSQSDVAKAIGVTRTAYVKYETGVSKPVRKLHELASYFNVSTDYLLGNESPQEIPLYALKSDETRLIDGYRSLDIGKRQMLFNMLAFLESPQASNSMKIIQSNVGNNNSLTVGGNNSVAI